MRTKPSEQQGVSPQSLALISVADDQDAFKRQLQTSAGVHRIEESIHLVEVRRLSVDIPHGDSEELDIESSVSPVSLRFRATFDALSNPWCWPPSGDHIPFFAKFIVIT